MSTTPLYSGLETSAMHLAACSLLIPPGCTFESHLIHLPPDTITTPVNDVFLPGAPIRNETVNFQATRVFYLIPKESIFLGVKSWPMTVLGMCRFTEQDHVSFQRAYHAASASSGTHEWPTVDAILRCPICNAQQSVGKEYWMICYFMVQMPPPNPDTPFLAFRQMPRLMCLPCMDRISQGCTMMLDNVTEPLSVYLHDYADLCMLNASLPPTPYLPINNIRTAWTLFTMWTETGTWTALGRFTANQLKLGLGAPSATAQCTTCLKQVQGSAIKKCAQCGKAVYCSRACQKADWKKQHKRTCVPKNG